VGGDFAGARQPDALGMLGNVGERTAQVPQAEGLADDVGVQGDAEDEWLLDRLFEHSSKLSMIMSANSRGLALRATMAGMSLISCG